jgi:hypothetical protein
VGGGHHPERTVDLGARGEAAWIDEIHAGSGARAKDGRN